jgi:cation-transporting ATPase 13A3/4/5
VLLAPAISVALVLDLITIPGSARITLAFVVLLNIAASFIYEDLLADHVASAIRLVTNWKGYSKKKRREGRVYESLGRG